MDAHERAVYRYCYRMMRDPSLAEDMLQTTFLQAYEGLEHFEGRSSLRTWLIGIARHRCLDALKARRRWDKTFELKDPETDPRASVSSRDPFDDYDWSRSLESCLEKLEDKIRDAVLLRYVEGLSYPEMERVSGDHAATLQMRVARALPVLRRCLESKGVRL
jgi:RNA polymerase sigma-70 factor, ECF subfamily